METVELQLLKQIKAGDEKAFRKLFYMYSDQLFIWAKQILQNREAAEDIVQDFFVGFWEKREILTVKTSFSAYAYKSIYNASNKYLRDNERFVYGYDVVVDLIDDDVEEEDVNELLQLLQKAIDELPERCRKIFVMVTIERKKYAEVANLLDISVNTVKVQVSKAFRIIKGKIG